MKIRSLSPATVIASIALLFALSGTAVAGALITGASVMNGSLTGLDVMNNTLGSADIQNGSLLRWTSRLASRPASRVPRGRRAPRGRPVLPGPQAPAGRKVSPGSAASRS